MLYDFNPLALFLSFCFNNWQLLVVGKRSISSSFLPKIFGKLNHFLPRFSNKKCVNRGIHVNGMVIDFFSFLPYLFWFLFLLLSPTQNLVQTVRLSGLPHQKFAKPNYYRNSYSQDPFLSYANSQIT